MTCIVGIEDGSDVVLGADSSIGWDGDLRDRMRGKIWARDGVGFGDAGSMRAGQVLFYELTIPPQPAGMPDLEWVVRRLAPAIASELEDAEEESAGVIVALNGCVYEIDGDSCVRRSPRGYAAIGSGGTVAIGALHATRGKTAQWRARTAVACAIEHVSSCGLPIELLRVPSRRRRAKGNR